MITWTKYGWKTENVVRKYYRVKQIGPLMFVDKWIEVDERLFPNRSKTKCCELCKKPWLDIPILEKVNIVIFEKKHKNKAVCDSCKCKILKSMRR